MKDTNTKVNLELSIDVKKKLQKEAEDREMSLSGLIRLILKEHLKNK